MNITTEKIMELVEIYAGLREVFGIRENNAATARARQAVVDALAAQQPSTEAVALGNLLARIHGDGGHYIEQHGLAKACEDAEMLVATWKSVIPIKDDAIKRQAQQIGFLHAHRDGWIEAPAQVYRLYHDLKGDFPRGQRAPNNYRADAHKGECYDEACPGCNGSGERGNT